MPQIQIKLKAWKCNKCGYTWLSRKKGKPVTCANPKCRSPYWDKSKR